jgi:hypothetical protein
MLKYQKRWFELTEDHLAYAKDPSEEEGAKIEVFEMADASYAKLIGPRKLEVGLPERKLRLKAEDARAAAAWVDALQVVVAYHKQQRRQLHASATLVDGPEAIPATSPKLREQNDESEARTTPISGRKEVIATLASSSYPSPLAMTVAVGDRPPAGGVVTLPPPPPRNKVLTIEGEDSDDGDATAGRRARKQHVPTEGEGASDSGDEDEASDYHARVCAQAESRLTATPRCV